MTQANAQTNYDLIEKEKVAMQELEELEKIEKDVDIFSNL